MSGTLAIVPKMGLQPFKQNLIVTNGDRTIGVSAPFSSIWVP